MTTCIVVASGLSLISCNGGGGSSGSTTNQLAASAMSVPDSSAGFNHPGPGGNNFGWEPSGIQYSGLYASPIAIGRTVVTPILATTKVAYALELTGSPNVNHYQETNIVAYQIKGDGTLGAQIGTPQGAGNFNLDDIDGTFRDEGRLVAINKKGTKLYVLNTHDNDISVFIINADGSLSGSGSYPLGQGKGDHPISIATISISNQEYIVVMDDAGCLQEFAVSGATLGTPQIYPNANVDITAKFDVMTVIGTNIYTIDNYHDTMWVWNFNSSGTPSLINTTALTTGINSISAVSCQGYIYVLNRGSLLVGGQTSITYYKEGINGASPSNPQTYTDSHGSGLVAKAIRTDGKRVFVFYAMPLSGSTIQNKVVSYNIDASSGALLYNTNFKFGKNPLSFVSDLGHAGQSAASLLNMQNAYAVDETIGAPGDSADVTTFSNMNGILSNIPSNNILLNEGAGASVVKMAKYTVNGHFVFFLIKTADGTYKLKADDILSGNGTNALNSYISAVNINGASSLVFNDITNIMDIMPLNETLYVLGTDANGTEKILAYKITLSATNGITLTKVQNVMPTTLVSITDTNVAHNRFLWGGNTIAGLLYVLLNNNVLQVFSINSDSSLTYSYLIKPPMNRTVTPNVPTTDFNDAHFGRNNDNDILYWRPGNGDRTLGDVMRGNNGSLGIQQYGLADICGTGTGKIAPGAGITNGSSTRRMFAVLCYYPNQSDRIITFGTNGNSIISGPSNTSFNNSQDKLIFTQNNNIGFILNKNQGVFSMYYSEDGNAHNLYNPMFTLGLDFSFQDTYLNSTSYATDMAFFNDSDIGDDILILDSDGSLILYHITGWNN